MFRTLITIALLHATIAARPQFCTVTISHEVNGLQVQYSASSPDNPSQWSWFFNGGVPMTSNEQNPLVTYSAPGTYTCAVSISGGPNDCSAALSNATATVSLIQTTVAENLQPPPPFAITSITGHQVEVFNAVAGRVSMAVLDLGGRKAGTLFEGVLPAGPGLFPLHQLNLGKGMYLLLANTGSGTTSHRFILGQ